MGCPIFLPSFLFSFFSFTTANDEVIVYFPTGGCLGDASLSAERWRNPQLQPTWVESWGQSVKSCRTLCVFHRCALFLTCTKATRVTVMPWAPCVSGLWHHQPVCFVYACLLMKHTDGGAWASYWLGAFSMPHICSMSQSRFSFSTHYDSMLDLKTIAYLVPTHMHTLTVYGVDNVQ